MTIVMFTYSETVIFSYFHFNCFLEWELEWFLMYLNQITEFCLTWRTLSFFSSNVSKLGMKNWFLISVPISTSVIFSLIDFYMGGGWHSYKNITQQSSPYLFLLIWIFSFEKVYLTIDITQQSLLFTVMLTQEDPIQPIEFRYLFISILQFCISGKCQDKMSPFEWIV